MSDQWKKLPKKIQDVILFGSDEEEISFSYDDNYQSYKTKKTLYPIFENHKNKQR